MSTRLSAHLRQNVVGYVAIFLFAIGGTAYATHPGGEDSISSEDIINGEVLSADVANDTIRAADVRNDTLPDGGLTAPDLAPDSVGSSEIANSAVATLDVQNNQIRSDDVRDDTLPGGGLTGAEIVESSLVGVNADRVRGVSATLIAEETDATTIEPIEILNLGGLIMRLECVNTDFFEPRLVAATSVDDAIIRSRAMPDFGADEVETITDDDFDSGAADEKTIYDATQGSGLINYHAPDGTVVTVQYMVDGFGTSVGGCIASGTALEGD